MGETLPEGEISAREPSLAPAKKSSAKPSVVVSHAPLRIPTLTRGEAETAAGAIVEAPAAPGITVPAFEHDDDASLREALGRVIRDILESGHPALLEGFGIAVPEVESSLRTYTSAEDIAQRPERTMRVSFEKCRELTAFHRERFPDLVETRDIARAVHAGLPVEQSLRWSERDTRSHILRFVRRLRETVVAKGYSAALGAIGAFYALHNRQGETLHDRFAGADIFLKPSFEKRLQLGDVSRHPRPILESAWEVLEAAFGKPLHTFEIDLLRELKDLGYAISPAEQERFLKRSTLAVAVFSTGTEKPTLIYATNGARDLAFDAGTGSGSELTFQLPVSSIDRARAARSVPAWPARALTLGWLLMLSARSKTVRAGVGLSADLPLIPDCDTDLCAIFSTPFRLIKHEQRTADGAFSFMNIVGITAAEAEIAERWGGGHLLALLSHRGLDQATKPTRSAVTARSAFEVA